MVLQKTETPSWDRQTVATLLAGKRVAVVASRFNAMICEGLLGGALGALESLGVTGQQVDVFRVPGAFDVPVVAKKVAASGNFAGVVALGCVIRGETPHFEFVSLAATLGCLQAALDTSCPVTFGVITVNTESQALERSGVNNANKGREATLALLETLETLRRL